MRHLELCVTHGHKIMLILLKFGLSEHPKTYKSELFRLSFEKIFWDLCERKEHDLGSSGGDVQ